MLLFLPSRPVRRAHVESYRRVRNSIRAEDLHKFIMNHVSWKSLPVEIEINRALIHCAVRWALTSNSIFYTKKPLLLDHKTRYEEFVWGKYVHIVWAIREYYQILSPVYSEADANGSWNTRDNHRLESSEEAKLTHSSKDIWTTLEINAIFETWKFSEAESVSRRNLMEMTWTRSHTPASLSVSTNDMAQYRISFVSFLSVKASDFNTYQGFFIIDSQVQ
jgi:hypothetical protein